MKEAIGQTPLNKVLEDIWPTEKQKKKEQRRFKTWEKRLRMQVEELLAANGVVNDFGLRHTQPVKVIDSGRSVWLWVGEEEYGDDGPDIIMYARFHEDPRDIETYEIELFTIKPKGKSGDILDHNGEDVKHEDLKNYLGAVKIIKELLTPVLAKP